MIIIKIDFLDSKKIQCQLTYNENILHSDTFISDTENISLSPLFLWIYTCIKNIFTLPLGICFKIIVNNSEQYPDGLFEHIKTLRSIIETTRKHLEAYQHIKASTSHFEGKLFLNLGNTPYLKQLFDQSFSKEPDKTYYDPCYVINKQEEGNLLPKPSVDELIKFILENHIGKIFSHNISYLSYFLEINHTYLPAIMEAIGVEFIIVDFDPYNQVDGYYYLKSFLNNSNCHRYCIMPHLESYWDQTFGLNNIKYFPMPYKVTEDSPSQLGYNDYDILVTTWARLEVILYYLKPILLFLDYVDDTQPFLDAHRLYQCMTRILLYETNLSHYEKSLYYKIFSMIYLHTISFFKFEVLEGIKTKRNIYLFGDNTWENFFPEYYQRPLNSKESADFSKISEGKTHLHLLMNYNYNYFENNPMMIRALNQNTPYLTFSSVIRTPEMDAMKLLEYSSIDELNKKVDTITDYISNKQYQDAKQSFARQLNPCIDDFFQNALGEPPHKTTEISFDKIIQEHQNLFHSEMISYLKTNMNRVHECMIRLMRRDYRQYTPHHSKYTSRRYFEKMLFYYESNKSAIDTSQRLENTL